MFPARLFILCALLASCGGGGDGPCPKGTKLVGTPGETSHHCETKDGQQEGPYEVRNSGGIVTDRGAFKNGKRDGVREEYWDHGELARRSNWKNGAQHGIEETWHQTDVAESKVEYQEGKRHGSYQEWWPDGRTLRVGGTYEQDLRHGKWVEFHEDGSAALDANYENDERVGDWTATDPDGSVFEQQRGITVDGKYILHGEQLRFDELANRAQATIYERGHLVAGPQSGARYKRLYAIAAPEAQYAFAWELWISIENGPFDTKLVTQADGKPVSEFPGQRPDMFEGGAYVATSGYGDEQAALWWVDKSAPTKGRSVSLPWDRLEEVFPAPELGLILAVGWKAVGSESNPESNPTEQWKIAAYDLASGNKRWEVPAPPSATLLVDSGLLVRFADSTLVRLEPSNGKDLDSAKVNGEPIAWTSTHIAVRDETTVTVLSASKLTTHCSLQREMAGDILIDATRVVFSHLEGEQLDIVDLQTCQLLRTRPLDHPLEWCTLEADTIGCSWDSESHPFDLETGKPGPVLSYYKGNGPHDLHWTTSHIPQAQFNPRTPWRNGGPVTTEITAHSARTPHIPLLYIPLHIDLSEHEVHLVPAHDGTPSRLFILHDGTLTAVDVVVAENTVSTVLSPEIFRESSDKRTSP